jgi:histidine ammonia-lyase
MSTHHISSGHLSINDLGIILRENSTLALSDESRNVIARCRAYLEERLANSDELLYGINTGFGALCNVRIEKDSLQQLQENLVRSHACGVGKPVQRDIAKLMLLLKIQSLSYGYSGVQVSTVERLIKFYNLGLIPVVFEKGSLGASGDLAPLAHLSLPLIGEGAFYGGKGELIPAKDALAKHTLQPIKLGAKEGLALLNGTQFMSAYGAWCIIEAQRISDWADLTAALSLDAYACKVEPFLPYIHSIRPHAGQKKTAEKILSVLKDSPLAQQPKKQVQDPYAFRCIPQVHGATKDAMDYISKVFETEINSVTDNPNIFPDENLILSGGNFHGQPLALALDHLKIALAELGNISERRTYNLISGQRGLPEFLVSNPGLNSGLMIPQYTAAALVSQNKQLATPASVDSIPSSNGQEDHVSMGANAALQAYEIVQNLNHILAIEWLNAAQAIEFRRPMKTAPQLEEMLSSYRKTIPSIEQDRILHEDIIGTVRWMERLLYNPLTFIVNYSSF